MNMFSNTTYERLANDLISDAFYVEGLSIDGKLATIRVTVK